MWLQAGSPRSFIQSPARCPLGRHLALSSSFLPPELTVFQVVCLGPVLPYTHSLPTWQLGRAFKTADTACLELPRTPHGSPPPTGWGTQPSSGRRPWPSDPGPAGCSPAFQSPLLPGLTYTRRMATRPNRSFTEHWPPAVAGAASLACDASPNPPSPLAAIFLTGRSLAWPAQPHRPSTLQCHFLQEVSPDLPLLRYPATALPPRLGHVSCSSFIL